MSTNCVKENNAPVAVFTVTPENGNTQTLFRFDASQSYDKEDKLSELMVRWDYEGDNIWDTGWLSEKTESHRYISPGIYQLGLEVRDSNGKKKEFIKQIYVVWYNSSLDIPSDPFPFNNSNNNELIIDLSWLCNYAESDSIEYDIYFGVNITPPLIERGWKNNFYRTDSLIPAENYYWKIIAKDDSDNISEGPMWYFSTKGNNMESSFTDPRDEKTYRIILVGDTWWMAENLDYVVKFGSVCYDNDNNNCESYHRLYNWETAMNSCPSGWHLPDDEEWKELEISLGMLEDIADNYGLRGTNEGQMMKATSEWFNNGNGTNESGFSALPAGQRNYSSEFVMMGEVASFWTASSHDDWDAWARELYYDKDGIYRTNYH
ncbi:FISUMP domain-containing protein, partial [Bacteroidota bacterium]